MTKQYIIPLIQYNLIKTLEVKGAQNRAELVEGLETPRTTIYDNLVKLEKRKVVSRFEKRNGKRGRPIVYWELSNDNN